MTGAYYDWEVFPNFMCVTFLDIACPQDLVDNFIKADIKVLHKQLHELDNAELLIEARENALNALPLKTFIIHKDLDQSIELYEFLDNVKLLIGFNSKKYDDLITDHLLIHKSLYLANGEWQITNNVKALSDAIISTSLNYRYLDEELKQFRSPYTSLDLYSALFEVTARKSLKQTAINLKWYRLEDSPIHFNTWINKTQFSSIVEYNINDVLITRALRLLKLGEISLRIDISNEYKINVLNSNRSNVADKLMGKFYAEYTGSKYWHFKDKRTYRKVIPFGDIINPKIQFKDPVLKNLLDNIKDTKFTVGGKFGYDIIFRDIGYAIGVGGLHSIDRPKAFTATDLIYRDADVSSYYPSLIINEKIAPAHLAASAFQQIAVMITTERLAAKRAKLKVKAEALKIVANSGLFGKFGSEDSWLFDLKCTYQTTLNGQLYLLMLIEQFEDNEIDVISANTDGVTSRFDPKIESTYNDITRHWQSFVGFELEFVDYVKYVRTSVNDYIAVKDGYYKKQDPDYIKLKGEFNDQIDISKGFNAPIIAKCLKEYYVNDIHFTDTLHNHDNIYDFCISVKTGEAYNKELHSIKDQALHIEDLSKNLRYYVSKEGGTLLKRHNDKNFLANMLKGELIIPFNDYIELDSFDKYAINYGYYERKIKETILKINNTFSKPRASRRPSIRVGKGVKQCGNLFD